MDNSGACKKQVIGQMIMSEKVLHDVRHRTLVQWSQ